jgi:hypothetical protein
MATKREATAVLAEIEADRIVNRGPGRPSTGTEIKARVPADVIASTRPDLSRDEMPSWAS